MPDLVFVSLENWDDVWRRNQFVCAELARRHPAMKVLFVGLPRNWSHAVRTRQWADVRAAAAAVPGLENVTVTRPPKLMPDSLAVGRWVNATLLRRHVRRAMRHLGIAGPTLWVNDHAAGHLVGRLGERAVVYDVTDDWTSLDQPEAVRRRTVAQDAALCRVADATIVCSDRLLDLKRPLARLIRLIPNGVDPAHYRSADDPATAAPATDEWPRPVLGYTGTVHPDRVDVDLVAAVARRWPGSVVMVGPNHLRPDDRAALAVPNVRLVGPVAYADVPAYMAGFDACVVPHRVTPFTESLNPIKLWEYLAAGKPVVSTPVAGFRDYPGLVRLATGADAFVAACEAAVAEQTSPDGPRLRDARRAVAADHSWATRVDQIDDVIRSAGDHRGNESTGRAGK